MLVAGEASGDQLGARLMAALIERTEGAVRFSGVGGEAMERLGLASLFPMGELSVMGLAEVLPRAPALLRRIAETVEAARRERPDALVTIDSPGFGLRVARRLSGAGIPRLQYVAPQVWAWRPGRARKLAAFLDHVLALLPFEPPYFERAGLACTFVGHPVVEAFAGQADGARFRGAHGLPADAPLLAMLPGSRHSEVGRHLPIFGAALGLLRQRMPDLRVVLPTVPAVAEQVAAAAAAWPIRPAIVQDAAEKLDAFAAADAALAASGTVALELALAGAPSVITYRANPLTALIARRLIRVRHVSLVNILLRREATPELLQDECRPDRLAEAVWRLLTDGDLRRSQREAFAELARLLRGDGERPSLKAADVVLNVIGEKHRKGR